MKGKQATKTRKARIAITVDYASKFFLGSRITRDGQTLKATHKARFYGLTGYWHAPTHTLWGCNIISDWFIGGIIPQMHNVFVEITSAIFPDWEPPHGFPIILIALTDKE